LELSSKRRTEEQWWNGTGGAALEQRWNDGAERGAGGARCRRSAVQEERCAVGLERDAVE
ncbi:hypothetical protein U1Q18_041640, partial [Sarracenia purpurea var. burkii]